MWIEQRKNGKFKAVERYEDYLTGKTKKVSVIIEKNTVQTRKLAQAALTQKIEAAQSYKKVSEKKEVTFAALVDAYRADQKKTVELSTYARNYSCCNTLMKIFGSDTLVNRMSARYIRDCLLATEKAPGTLNEYLTRLKALLRWGYQNDLIADIRFLDKVARFKDKPHKEKIEDKFLESHEVDILLDNMSIDKWKELTKFLVLSGLRIGEALALTPGDVNLKKRIIKVTCNYDHRHNIVKKPKNSSSIRDVYIQDELLPLCKELRRKALIMRLVTGKDLFFQDENGRLQYAAYNKYLKENTIKHVGKELTAHVLRHTHVALLAEQGVELEVISRRLGHSNSKVTREVYFHVTKKLQEKDYQRVAGVKLL